MDPNAAAEAAPTVAGYIRAAITLALFVLFVTLCAWAWSGRRRADFEAAARLPFDESDPVAHENEEQR